MDDRPPVPGSWCSPREGFKKTSGVTRLRLPRAWCEKLSAVEKEFCLETRESGGCGDGGAQNLSPFWFRLVGGTTWLLLGNLASRFSSLIGSIIAARLLGQTAFGELGIITSTVALFALVSETGMGTTNSRYVSHLRVADRSRLGPVLSLSLLTVTLVGVTVAVMVSFLASYLAASVLGSADLAGYLRMGAVLVVTISLEGVLAGALNGFQEFRMIGRANIVQALVALPTTVICVFTAGLTGAVAALTLSSALRVCLMGDAVVKLLRREGIRLSCKGIWGERGVLWRFALPAMGSGLLVMPVTWWCSIVLARQAGGYAGLGLFNAANQWRTALLFVPNIVGNVTLPLLAEAYGQDGYRLAGKLMTPLFRLFWTALLPATVILVGFSKPIMTLYGRGFQDGYAVLAVLVLATYVQAILTCLASLIAASGRMWLGMAMNLGWAAILLGATYMLVPQFGVLGLAVAYLAAYTLHMLWALAFGASVSGASFLKETAAMLLTAFGTCSGILWLTTLGPWVASVGALGVAGVLLIRVWWCLPQDARESVIGIVRGFVTGGVHR